MSDEELHDELMTLLVAGHETTATALAWTFRWLLERPDVTARMRRELAQAEAEGPLSPERIAKLELLDAVAREALRLQPVLPLVGRILQRPARVGGYDLPAGVGVVCSIYLAQRRPRLPRPRSGSTPTASSARSSRRTSSSPSAAASVAASAWRSRSTR